MARSISKPNLRRELLAETGLDIDELDSEPGWTVVLDGAVVAILKKLTARPDASELRTQILQYLATEALTSTLGCRGSCMCFSQTFGDREFGVARALAAMSARVASRRGTGLRCSPEAQHRSEKAWPSGGWPRPLLHF